MDLGVTLAIALSPVAWLVQCWGADSATQVFWPPVAGSSPGP